MEILLPSITRFSGHFMLLDYDLFLRKLVESAASRSLQLVVNQSISDQVNIVFTIYTHEVCFDPIQERLFHVVCPETEGVGVGGLEREPVTLKFFPLDTNYRNQILHDVRYTFDESIC